MIYGKVLSCRFEDVDGYGFLEMTPTSTSNDEGEMTTGDTCQIRLACFRLDGATMDEVAENLLPDETPTIVDENGNPVEEDSAAPSKPAAVDEASIEVPPADDAGASPAEAASAAPSVD